MPLDELLTPDSAVYKTLLESTKAIPWRIDWASMAFTYIGPQIEPLLGWERDSWLSVNDWAERIHPDDREAVVNFCVAQSQSGIDHEADYRALTRDNGYVWIRDVVHVVRNAAGEVEALVGFMFDISERKKTEEKLLSLQKELEALSFKDGLTGIANRRKFDAQLHAEWANAQRSSEPLSLILLDIDYFKQYNDLYGHLQGDECLRQVAQTLQLAAAGPRDLAARFGGEEFVILLPNSDHKAAQKVAARCLRLIDKLQLPHANSSGSHHITASFGVGTLPAGDARSAAELVAAVDRLLYRAKQQGRHCIVSDQASEACTA
ncbi:sensor domain-containing diguanylate cyclase [Chitinibacter tainanensis]|uniref:sensor domain-containing diguanylate cyclase n=1 Tax=Chitinibacter tainanensis TaxID=230667 RepID=UPI0003FA09AA|nr:sensor domain-containing diguanylate cyclase [Chitinibacter tainanensis]